MSEIEVVALVIFILVLYSLNGGQNSALTGDPDPSIGIDFEGDENF